MKKIYLIAFLLSFLLMSCWTEVEDKETIYYSTWTVFSWAINLNDSYVGYIKWDKMVNLATKVWWRVTDVFVKEWDLVYKWDLLLTLDSHEAKSGYSTASSIINTLMSMRKDTEAMFNDQIKSMEAKVEQVKLWNIWIKNGLKDTISITNSQLETARVWMETAKVNLDHTKVVLETKERHVYDNSKDAIVSAVILDTNIMNFVDTLLWITEDNKDKNDSFEDYLWAKNTWLNTEAKAKFYEILVQYNNYKEFYDTKIDGKTPSYDDINKWLVDGENLAENLKTLLSLTYDILDASIANVSFPQTTIDNYKNQISTFWNNIEASLITVSWDYFLGLKWSRQSIDDFNRESKMQLDLLAKQYELAQKTYAQYEAMSKWQVNEVTTKSDVTWKQLDEILAWLNSLKKQKQSKLREIDAKIDEARGQQNSAWVMINNWKIVSPITWVVTSKMVKIWQVVGWWMPLMTVSNIDTLEVDVNISEELATNLNIWDEVILEIEWVDKQIIWNISNINLSKDLITKKVWVKISVLNENNQIQIWSFTKVIFQNSTKSNWILISNDAIISQFMIPWVYVIEDNKVVFKNIEIIKQNDSFSEVKWLNVWDVIITKWKENLYDGESLK